MASPASAWGQAPPSPAVAPPPIVEIIAIPDSTRIAILRDVLGPHPFASASVRWATSARFDKRDVLHQNAQQADVTVRAWVDLSDPSATALYFANGSANRFLVRELPLSPSAGPLAREALGQVLALSVTALLDDDAGSLDRKQAEAILDTHAPAPSAETPPAPLTEAAAGSGPSVTPPFEVTLFYTAQVFAREVPVVHGPGVAGLSRVHRGRVTLSVWTSAQYELPIAFERDGVGVDLWAAALRAGLEGDIAVGRLGARRPFANTFVGLALGAGGDVVRVTPVAGTFDPPAMLAPPHWSFDPVITAAFRIETTLFPFLDVALAPIVDVLVDPAHYDFRTSGVVTTVLAPFSVRPGVLVGLSLR